MYKFEIDATAISIHAPRGGSDEKYNCNAAFTVNNFNPRSPWGERRFSAPLPEVKL